MQEAELSALSTSFRDNGFAIARSFFKPEQVEEICWRAERILSNRTEFSPTYTNITKGLEKADDFFEKLLNEGPQVPLLQKLLGTKPIPATASFFTKNKNYEEIYPHIDAVYGGVIWVALDDTNRENGCIHFLKGSHKHEAEFAHLRPNQPNDLSNHPDLVEAAMSAGDMLLFQSRTVHWSGPNHNGTQRRGFNCFYTGRLD
jgi:hypothetical protein